jgi:hypothetical protein
LLQSLTGARALTTQEAAITPTVSTADPDLRAAVFILDLGWSAQRVASEHSVGADSTVGGTTVVADSTAAALVEAAVFTVVEVAAFMVADTMQR